MPCSTASAVCTRVCMWVNAYLCKFASITTLQSATHILLVFDVSGGEFYFLVCTDWLKASNLWQQPAVTDWYIPMCHSTKSISNQLSFNPLTLLQLTKASLHNEACVLIFVKVCSIEVDYDDFLNTWCWHCNCVPIMELAINMLESFLHHFFICNKLGRH